MADLFDRLKTALADRYAIERELGRGGMATVYLAEDLKHHRKVAIKVLHPELAVSLGPDRFLREVEIAAQLTHPHILPLLDSGQADGLLFYVMPYVEGESLRAHMSGGHPLPSSDAVRILRDVVDALAYAHGHGVAHRDIKPDNVMLSGRHALVTDFGVAKALTVATGAERLTETGMAIGTPAYMAPEQAAADPHIDHRADIYAVGVLAYEMLTGRTPFAGSALEVLAAHVTERPDPVTKHQPGIPPALATLVMRSLEKRPDDRWQSADELLTELEGHVTPAGGTVAAQIKAALARWLQPIRRQFSPVRAVVGSVSLALAAMAVAGVKHSADVRRTHQELLPAIQRLVDDAEWGKAYSLAAKARKVIPHDSVLAVLSSAFTGPLSVHTEPPGAYVYRKDYGDIQGEWELLGTTPFDSARVPLAFSYSRLMVVKAGFDTVLDVAGPGARQYQLDFSRSLETGMVRVTGGKLGINLVGLDHLEPIDLAAYLIDRYETTNREFKRFVDAGGYQKKEFWRTPFVEGGKQISWERAIASFEDRTGRPGPANWEVGDYPSGQDDFPVTGVSWYEAAAYAAFAGKQLPTIYHWAAAARVRMSSSVVPASNIDARASGPARVGAYPGLTGFGTMDMAGNAREWVVNESGNQRYLLGGSWDDSPDMFTGEFAASPFDRSPQNGFRLVKYLSDSNLALASRPITQPYRDFRKMRPVSDAIFALYRRMYQYDPAPLRAKVEETDSSSKDWVKQRITFDAAYGHERMMAYLFLPTKGRPPYQTVMYFPGDGSVGVRSSQNLSTALIDFIIKSGRAVVLPIYKSTFERGDGLTSTYPTETNSYREHVIEWAQDLMRSIDYVETRQELDATTLAYYGYSWGGRLGGIMLSVEPRFKAAVLNVAGLRFQKGFPEVEPINFLPRIKIPVLMLNGRYDFYFPVESSQKPMFEALGTSTQQKRQVIAEGSHFVPRPLLIKETLDWLDRYLGPVQ